MQHVACSRELGLNQQQRQCMRPATCLAMQYYIRQHLSTSINRTCISMLPLLAYDHLIHLHFCDMQAVTKKKEASSSRKSELHKQKSDLEERVQGLDERLENALIQREVGCLHHAVRHLHCNTDQLHCNTE